MHLIYKALNLFFFGICEIILGQTSENKKSVCFSDYLSENLVLIIPAWQIYSQKYKVQQLRNSLSCIKLNG
jgi:hypothetical protein